MSVILRGSLVIMMILIMGFIMLYQKSCDKSLVTRCKTYILLLGWFSPVMDLGFGTLGFGLSGYVGASILFLLFNQSIFSELPKNINRGIIGLICVYLISAIFSDFVMNSIDEIIIRVIPFITFAAIWILMKNGKTRCIYLSFIIMSIYAIVWALIQQFVSKDFTLYFLNRIGDNRVVGIFSEPQTAGCMFAMLAIFFFNQYKAYNRHISLLMFVGLAIMGSLTGSKTSLLGLLASLPISLLFYKINNSLIFE